MEPRKTKRGVYLDLEASPYSYQTEYGDFFKFSSRKKMEIYVRDLPKELARVDALLGRHGLCAAIPEEIETLLKRELSKVFYRRVER
jgi:hypothetical protein